MAERWGGEKQPYKIFGGIVPGAPVKEVKYYFFSVRNTTHCFGRFCFTDFHETWHQYVNPVLPVLMNRFVAKLSFSVQGSLFRKNRYWDSISVALVNLTCMDSCSRTDNLQVVLAIIAEKRLSSRD